MVLRSECMYPSKIHVEILTSKVIILGSGAFGRCLGYQRRILMNRISALMEQTPESPLVSSQVRTQEVKSAHW